MKMGAEFEQRAKLDLEERGYIVRDANALKPNNKFFDLIIERTDGTSVYISVKFRAEENWPIANGTIKKGPDGNYEGVEKIKEKLLDGGFTIIYHKLKKNWTETVYIVPHNVIKPLLPLWVKHRKGREHTFVLNRKTAAEIGLDIQRYENAWHHLPTP